MLARPMRLFAASLFVSAGLAMIDAEPISIPASTSSCNCRRARRPSWLVYCQSYYGVPTSALVQGIDEQVLAEPDALHLLQHGILSRRQAAQFELAVGSSGDGVGERVGDEAVRESSLAGPASESAAAPPCRPRGLGRHPETGPRTGLVGPAAS